LASLRTTALAYAESLEWGFVSVDAVAIWIDRKMHELAEPPIGLIEACCAGHKSQAVVDALRSITGEFDDAAVARQCFWHAAAALARDDSLAESIAEWLDEEPGGIRISGSDFGSFGCEFDLVSAGVSQRSRSEVARALRSKLSDNGERPN